MMPRHQLLERFSNGRALVGLLQTHPSPMFSEMIGLCGYDFVILDGEHGVFTEKDYLDALLALRATGAAALVRLKGHDSQAVGRFLDMGADGIVAPGVSTAEQAKALVRAMEYPPVGTRGFGAGAHWATCYGRDMPAHLASPREGICLLVMIETALGVANAEEILSVDGVDGVFVGPADLSADLGCAWDFSQAAYAQAFSRIEHAAITRKKVLGTGPHPGYPIPDLVSRGHRLLLIGADTPLIRAALTSQLSNARLHLS